LDVLDGMVVYGFVALREERNVAVPVWLRALATMA
jgi:hypothetical protein